MVNAHLVINHLKITKIQAVPIAVLAGKPLEQAIK